MPGQQRRGGGSGGNTEGGNRRDNRREGGRGNAPVEKTPHLERVVAINRVAKVVKGGRRFSFTALVIVGDGDGTVGNGYGKGKEVPAAIAKGVEEAKKHFFKVPRIGASLPHPLTGDAAAGGGRRAPCSPSRPPPVPASSPVARCVPCWSARASTTCSRRASARRTRSTSCTPPWRRSGASNPRRRWLTAAAFRSRTWPRPACCARVREWVRDGASQG